MRRDENPDSSDEWSWDLPAKHAPSANDAKDKGDTVRPEDEDDAGTARPRWLHRRAHHTERRDAGRRS